MIVKIILLVLSASSVLSALAADKTQYLIHLRSNSILQSIIGIFSNFPKLLKYFNGTAVVLCFRIPFTPSATEISYNLVLYSEDLKFLLLAISASKLAASSFE